MNAADMIVSLIPQTDMALALTRRDWIAFVRGLPWPAQGEASRVKRIIWKTLEQTALSRANAVWATTQTLRDDMGHGKETKLVTAGIAKIPRRWNGEGTRSTAVWAARYNQDKNPELFFQALRDQEFEGKMFGSGVLEDKLRISAPSNIEVAGWAGPDQLWENAFAYVGTSTREAFGRSALEAAMSGIPIVVSDAFGVAKMLVTDDELRRKFVLPVSDQRPWADALRDLHRDEALRRTYSDHLVRNAMNLTIEASAQAVARELAVFG
ncbi:glycosyltransferase [Microbacterium nanhaiense]|nr:glycosyltransferase [Microbacterium nanhaiense]